MASTPRALRGLFATVALFTFQAVAHTGDVFVDEGASGNDSGGSWGNAYEHLQDALAAAQEGDTIYIAGGVYVPDRSSAHPAGTGNRFTPFRIEQDLTLLGGYAGSSNPGNPGQYNPSVYTTVLTGDLLQNDGGLLNPMTVSPAAPERQDNSAHVVVVANDPGISGGFMAVSIEDVVIQGGFAREANAPGGFAREANASSGVPEPTTGGGLCCFATNTTTGLAVTLDRCTVQGNFAKISGGGISSAGHGMLMRDCRVVGNVSRHGAGYVGLGQEVDDSHAHLTVVRTLWALNHVRMVSTGSPEGGAMALDRAFVDARSCVYHSNSTSPGNTPGRGGAIYVHDGSVLRADNNTFRENRNFGGTEGATLYCEDLIGTLEFVNNICWGAEPVDSHMRYPDPWDPDWLFGSNDIEDKDNNLPDDPNPGFDIDEDPMFANALGRLHPDSPCIDAGRNQAVPSGSELDFDGITRILDHPWSDATGFGGLPGWGSDAVEGMRPIVDMGAIEFMLDCNDNGVPDVEDIASGWSDDCDDNDIPDECQADCNSDGVPDVCDPDCNFTGTSDFCDIIDGTSEDCNGNWIPDECDLAPGGVSDDCNFNGVPDECDEPDCNDNDIPDECDIGQGTSEDCNGNGIPDECDLAPGGASDDCNFNGVPDECDEPDCNDNDIPDICEWPFPDCNGTGIPDECELEGNDCNSNGIPDECDVDCNDDGIPEDCQFLEDCNADGVPDECQALDDCNGNDIPDECEWPPFPDCNGNGIPDECELDGNDCNLNGVPDECDEPDCNGNNVPDECDIDSGFSLDCNGNDIPDECDAPDCNSNGIPDECDIDSGFSQDCNGNRVPDECDIADGTSNDINDDGVPDECQHDCFEGPGFTRYEQLTPDDTFSAVTGAHTPELEAGFVFVNVTNKEGDALAYNHLIGTVVVLDGIDSFDYQVNAASFSSSLPEGDYTDIDLDCHLDLNGVEYAMAPDELLVPRFLGQDRAAVMGGASLVLVGLSGGTEFETNVEFLVYNDNEEVFSTEYSFRSWAKVRLVDISAVFTQEFLRDFTSHDPGEVLGSPDIESGWFRAKGRVANSGAMTVDDPAIYGFLIDRGWGRGIGAADLPFETGSRAGHLLPADAQGDNEEEFGANQTQPGVQVHRRRPGSLLLYPEFDNRDGVFSILTVTNVGPETVTSRFVYYGG